MSQLLIITKKILTNILAALYKPFGFSCLLSFFALFFYLYAYYPSEAGKGWKAAIHTWFTAFKVSSFFRKLFLLVFVTGYVINRGLFIEYQFDLMIFNLDTVRPDNLIAELINIYPVVDKFESPCFNFRKIEDI